MPNMEKVINYLESEIYRAEHSVNDIWLQCVEVKLLRDALALLKEQDNCENCAMAIEDRQPVVRCKDCTWWGADRMCENSDSPCFQNGCTHGNWYCADGEVGKG